MSRGTSNSNERGSSYQRAVRRQWLVDTFRADVDVQAFTIDDEVRYFCVPVGQGKPACRCFRCGKAFTVDTLTVDRIISGVKGGTYRRNNIRPACATCNSSTGGQLGALQRALKAVA